MLRRPPTSPLFPYTSLFRSLGRLLRAPADGAVGLGEPHEVGVVQLGRELAAPVLVEIARDVAVRSEEHTSELQSPYDLVCRLLLEKKNEIRSSSLLYFSNCA